METKEEIKIRFIIDEKDLSLEYSPLDLLNKSEEEVLEDIEECDCKLNESNPHCEGDCLKYEGSSITGYIIESKESINIQDFINKVDEQIHEIDSLKILNESLFNDKIKQQLYMDDISVKFVEWHQENWDTQDNLGKTNKELFEIFKTQLKP